VKWRDWSFDRAVRIIDHVGWLQWLPVLVVIGLGISLGGCRALHLGKQVNQFPETAISVKADWFDPQLAPDGQWLAFLLTAPESGLWLVAVSTSEMRPLAEDELAALETEGGRVPSVTHTNPGWSPMGDRLAFLSYAGFAPGTDFRLWSTDGENFWATSVLYESVMPLQAYKWSPDGEKIGIVDGDSLVLVGPDKQKQVLIQDEVNVYPLAPNALAWSPGSEWLVCSLTGSLGEREMWAINVYTKERIQFASSQDGSVTWLPSWSPNGQWVALLESHVGERGRSVPPRMLIFDKEGAPIDKIGLPEVEIYLGTPVLWSPRGQHIAAVFWHGSARDVWVVGLRDDSFVQVTENGDVSDVIRWSDDGKQLLVRTESAIEPVYVPQ